MSAGNAAAVSVADYLDFYADDPATSVGLAYIEGITDGSELMSRLGGAARRKPLVVLKGGATAGGARAAASHTGALAADDKVFDGACRAARHHAGDDGRRGVRGGGHVRHPAAAGGTERRRAHHGRRMGRRHRRRDHRATRPRAADAARRPAATRSTTNCRPRWSRNNPVDCAGGETRDTIPEVMELIAEHPDVDAIVYIGLGIQSNQARLMREGGFYPDHGLERIVDYHERQDGASPRPPPS